MFTRVFRIGIAALLIAAGVAYPEFVGAQIAPGVQQSAAHTGNVTGTVTQGDGAPVANANVRLTGAAVFGTTSDARGTFSLISVPYGAYTITVTANTLGTASRGIIVKGDINVSIQYISQANNTLKTIARVSTHSAGAQINATPASIVSVSPSEYAFQGNTTWRELLNQIPGVSVTGELNGGNSSANVIPDSPLQQVIISINGALPYETSVTLDGMPLQTVSLSGGTPGAGTDLGFLPMPMFDTADIVRGPGANAPSIVDSIGGSFVLHAPGHVDTNQFEFSASNDPYGGIVSNAKAALHVGRLSATLVYGINNSPGPLGSRNVISALSYPPATINGQPFLQCTPPTGCESFPQASPIYQDCGCYIQDSLLYCCVPINSAWSQHSGAIALSYNITPSITAQVLYVGSSVTMATPNFGITSNFTPGAGYTGSISPGMHTYFDVLGTTQSQGATDLKEEKLTVDVGRGVLRLAALQNNSFLNESRPDFEPNGQYTVWGTGYYAAAPSTQVTFNGTSANLIFPAFGETVSCWSNNRDLLLSYATQLGSKSSIGVSYVTSYYNSPSELNFPAFDFSESQSNAISETTDEFRFNAGTEVSDKLSLDASWYIAKGLYHVPNPSNPGTFTNSTFSYSAPRIGVVWHASRDTVIRAAAGGGYALPPLSFLVGSSFICNIGPYYYESKPNLNLEPEKSFGFDLGADIRLHHDTVVSLDLYRTNLYGQFYASTTLTGMYLGLPLYTSEEGNLAQSRYEGINVEITHDVAHGIYWHGAIGLTRGYVVSVPPGFYNDPLSGPNSINTGIVPGINFDGQSTSGLPAVPYANGSAQFGYRWSPQKYVDLSPTYYGKDNAYLQPAFLELDAHASYPLTKNVSLLATFRNITGAYDGDNQILSASPILGAPTVTGMPYPLYGLPYGPRTVIVTAHVQL